MTTVATTAPELALTVAALTIISPHLAGAYNVNLDADEVKVQGHAEDVLHMVDTFGLTAGREHDSSTAHFAEFSGPAPVPFAAVTIRVVAVSR